MQALDTTLKAQRSGAHSHRWGVILAGGDGKRLLPLTRRISGDDRPKQFCRLMVDETLLLSTLGSTPPWDGIDALSPEGLGAISALAPAFSSSRFESTSGSFP